MQFQHYINRIKLNNNLRIFKREREKMDFKIAELNDVTAAERDAVDYLMIFMTTATFVAMVC